MARVTRRAHVVAPDYGQGMAARVIVALDVSDVVQARTLVARLGDACDFYKVGLELFATEGPDIVRWLRGVGKEVFVDLKLHDIPNTVGRAARSVARLGASLLTVHAAGGTDMVRAAVDGVAEGGSAGDACAVLGVTVLTSLDGTRLASAWGRGASVDVQTEVLRLAGLVAAGDGMGIVCSGHEAAAVRASFGDRLGLLVPGIRLPGDDTQDQRRVMTPGMASAAGARWLILGRTVTGAPDPVAALAAVHASIRGA